MPPGSQRAHTALTPRPAAGEPGERGYQLTDIEAGAGVMLENQGWNRDIAPGASATVGLLGGWTTSNAAPTAFALNEVPCTTG